MQANINHYYLLSTYANAISKNHYLHMRMRISNLGYILYIPYMYLIKSPKRHRFGV
jgi:hypothetical protein